MAAVAIGAFALGSSRGTHTATRQASTTAAAAPVTSATTVQAVTATSATSPPTTAALPTVTFGSYTGIRPAEIAISGDGTNVMTGITWSSWSQDGASGQGTVDIESCNPDCASGGQTPTPTMIHLSGYSGGQFTSLQEDVTGQPPFTEALPAANQSAS